MGGDLVFLSLVIFDRVAAVQRTAYQNKYCSPGLGAGASTSEKTTRFPERKTGGFVSLGTSLPCLQGYYLYNHTLKRMNLSNTIRIPKLPSVSAESMTQDNHATKPCQLSWQGFRLFISDCRADLLRDGLISFLGRMKSIGIPFRMLLCKRIQIN